MNLKCVYLGTNRKEFEFLNSSMVNNIIFAYISWDQVTHSEDAETIQKVRTYCIRHALKHTILGEKSIHFLSSHDGIKARIENDLDALVKSRYSEFIVFLAEFRTSYCGKYEVKNLVNAMEAVADGIRNHAAILNYDGDNMYQEEQNKAIQIRNAAIKNLDKIIEEAKNLQVNY